ncbi:hypothetical protein CL628_00800 [bacterium]|nr:hypothetical protein [bacterium]
MTSGILLTHRRLVTFLATGLTMAGGWWLLLSLLARTLGTGTAQPTIMLVASVILLVVWGVQWRSFKAPGWHTPLNLNEELVPLVATALVLLGAVPVLLFNGWQGDQFVMHGFYHGDTTTFASLTQRSLLSEQLVSENVFAGNGPLEYPTLLHAGIGDAIRSSGGSSVLAMLPWLTIIGILVSIPTLWLLWDLLVPAYTKGKKWLGISGKVLPLTLQLLLPLYVLTLSWDRYIYPQSHFFLTGLYIVLAVLLVSNTKASGRAHYVPLGVATILTLVLLLSNAVTGTAALVLLLAQNGIQVINIKRPPRLRAVHLILAVAAVLVFLIATPGQGAIGLLPGLSYTAAGDMLRLALPLLILVAALLMTEGRRPYLNAAVGGLSLLTVVTYIFSGRDIVVANSSRFFYHAILIAFPLAVYPIVRVVMWVKRQLLHTSTPTGTKAGSWAFVLAVLFLVALPGLASGASAYDNLLTGEVTIVTTPHVEALTWITTNTAPTDVVIAHPDSPWLIPLFTGRALLRTNYWLDPNDALTQQLNDAFAGDTDAQVSVAGEARYVLLQSTEVDDWANLPDEPVFSNRAVSIYGL